MNGRLGVVGSLLERLVQFAMSAGCSPDHQGNQDNSQANQDHPEQARTCPERPAWWPVDNARSEPVWIEEIPDNDFNDNQG